jgi:hypothetical protein
MLKKNHGDNCKPLDEDEVLLYLEIILRNFKSKNGMQKPIYLLTRKIEMYL